MAKAYCYCTQESGFANSFVSGVGLEPTQPFGYIILSDARKPIPPSRRPLFLPRCVGVRLWQFGHSTRKFSNRLSCRLPLMWSSSRGRNPSLVYSAHPHFSHCFSLIPSAKSLFFNLKL